MEVHERGLVVAADSEIGAQADDGTREGRGIADLRGCAAVDVVAVEDREHAAGAADQLGVASADEAVDLGQSRPAFGIVTLEAEHVQNIVVDVPRIERLETGGTNGGEQHGLAVHAARVGEPEWARDVDPRYGGHRQSLAHPG